MLFTLSAIGALCGPPISGAVHDATGAYDAAGAYAGTSLSPLVIHHTHELYVCYNF